MSTVNTFIDLRGFLHWQFGFDDPGMLIQDDYDVLYYVGMKDDNGKDICEGDFIVNNADMIFQVVFEMGAFRADPNPIEKKGFFWQLHTVLPCRIIGNIYENPELLEVENGKRQARAEIEEEKAKAK